MGSIPDREIKIPHATAQQRKKAAARPHGYPCSPESGKTVLKTGTNGLPKLIQVPSAHKEESAHPDEGWKR